MPGALQGGSCDRGPARENLSSCSALGSEEGPGLPSLWDPWQRQDDPCGFMGLHRSQKQVISSAGSFPVLNNGALILGFPGLSSVDFGIEGDCVRTLSQLQHLRHLFPPVSTLASPPVDWTQSAGPGPHSRGPQHRHPLDWEKEEALKHTAYAAQRACVKQSLL